MDSEFSMKTHLPSLSPIIKSDSQLIDKTFSELTLSYCKLSKKRIYQQSFYFENFEEFQYVENTLKCVNRVKDRYLAILINPISGKKRARPYFRNILHPMLRHAGIEYKVFETDSPTFVEDWVDLYTASSFNFTDIICIGGDGLFSQLLNAIGSHPDHEKLMKIPIGVIPCGSTNAIA